MLDITLIPHRAGGRAQAIHEVRRQHREKHRCSWWWPRWCWGCCGSRTSRCPCCLG